MRNQATVAIIDQNGTTSPAPAPARPQARPFRRPFSLTTLSLPGYAAEQEVPQSHAEVFYLQKQIQTQTPMIILLEDGETIEGCIEWYDRNTLKVRGRSKTLVYKSAIKYMYKVGEAG